MKKLLWLVDLLHYDHEGCVNFYDKRRGAITLQLIISAVDENILSSILREFGEIPSAKIFWDILEMKKWSENVEVDEGIVVENGDCVDSLVTGTETENDIIEVAMINEESMSVADSKITFSDLVNSTEIDNGDECITANEPLGESLVNLVKYDDENFSSECWFHMLQEKKLIDDLLSGKVTLLTDQVDETTIGKKDEERKALLEEKNEKNQYGSSYDFSYDCNNVFECAGLQDNNSFSVVTDYEENMEENEEIDEENIESIFMVWSPKKSSIIMN
jgi:hypothetical protein